MNIDTKDIHCRTAAEAIDLYHRATDANQRTAVCLGNTIIIDADTADDVLLTGDLHGNAANLDAIVARACLENHPRRQLVFQEICHGGGIYSNGGCRSHRVLESVAEMKTRFPQHVHHILSNHEMAELTEYPIQKSRQLLNMTFAMGLRYCYGDDAESVRLAMVGYLESCPLAVRVAEKLFFSHSIPERLDQPEPVFDKTIFYRALDPGSDFLRDGSVYRMVWGRDYRQTNADLFAGMMDAEVLVTGHEPVLDGYKFPNSRQAVIDCCGPSACCMLVPTDGSVNTDNYRNFVFRLNEETS